MKNPIKIGIVGLGRAGWGMHVPELSDKQDMFKITAVCDVLPERNEKAKAQFGCNTYDSVEDLVKDPEVELVDIATRSCDHYKHACIALDAGKDVFLEKPACVNYEQFADLMQRSNRPGKPRLFFRQNRRFELGFMELKNIIESGILGDVFELRLVNYGFEHRDDWQTISKYGGGQMNNWGPHLIDHALQLMGCPVVNVSSNRIHAAAGGDCEDHFTITMTGENGRYATVSISGSTALNDGRNYTVYGNRGAAVMENNIIKLRYIDPEQIIDPVISSEATPGSMFGTTGTYEVAVQPKWIEKEVVTSGEDLSVIWVHLYETYRNNVPFPVKTEEVDALMQVISKAKQNEIIRFAK